MKKSFCGWICPLGSVQQALGWIGQRLWPRAYNKVPRWLERILHYLKWAVLAWVLVQTARTGRLIFQDWDPYYNLYRIWTDEIAISGSLVTEKTAGIESVATSERFRTPLPAEVRVYNGAPTVHFAGRPVFYGSWWGTPPSAEGWAHAAFARTAASQVGVHSVHVRGGSLQAGLGVGLAALEERREAGAEAHDGPRLGDVEPLALGHPLDDVDEDDIPQLHLGDALGGDLPDVPRSDNGDLLLHDLLLTCFR